MTTPRNSMSGALPAHPVKGPVAMKPAQKIIPKRVASVVGPTQNFFMRESKALGAVQIMNGLFHIALGGLLMTHMENSVPITVTAWYPLWGGIMVRGKMIMNSASLFAAISGIILLIMDIFNVTVSHFLKMENSNLNEASAPLNIHNCEALNSSEKTTLHMEYCYRIRSVFLSLFVVMLIFAFFQKLVTAGAVENEWRKLCSRPKADVVLLSAEEKKEQAVEIKEEVVELTEISVQPNNEEDIEIIPVQEEEEETEINFPEPPQEQESSPVENDSVP
ncbi:B-lymphocyte antigen CD20 isoform X2 [Artibeus jamaicensis]|uniref:B-lymphocyte antigen CD20 isoform X2 n=1 Tax=Artibeus jamaicensis TaxID=9417 RepID=UPI00235AB251|nr:B-lymphocyte antigen CD20 isoform X2 [Artibeus jamaicensis]